MLLSRKYLFTALALIAAVTVFVWQPFAEPPAVDSMAQISAGQLAVVAPSETKPVSPFDLAADSDEPYRPIVAEASDASGSQSSPATMGGINALVGNTIAAYEIARTAISDAEFERLAQLLRNDPALFQNLLEEFRLEVDAERLSRLTLLLAEVGGDELTLLASDMVYSGDNTSQLAGLELLRRIQADDPAARDIIITMLSGETNTDTLVAALNAVSTPGIANPAQTQSLVDQVKPLASHENVQVRRNSLTILSRWANDASVTPQLRAGLADTDPGIRSTATYAFVDYPFVTHEVKRDLLAVLENGEESRRIRSGAMLALQSMELDTQQQSRLERAIRQLNTRVAQP
jgi:DNA-binding response OmpR family regulator